MAEHLLANVERELGQELRETALDRKRFRLWARRLCLARAFYEANSLSMIRSHSQFLSGGSGSV